MDLGKVLTLLLIVDTRTVPRHSFEAHNSRLCLLFVLDCSHTGQNPGADGFQELAFTYVRNVSDVKS